MGAIGENGCAKGAGKEALRNRSTDPRANR